VIENESSRAESRDENQTIFPLELNTMPGWAGSSWYWLRYMDVDAENEIASKEAIDYWQNVDLYIGGSEHATGHLLYSRFWNKFLKDMGIVPTEEPFQKLINQGMILGMSAYAYRLSVSLSSDEPFNGQFRSKSIYNIFISKNDLDKFKKDQILPSELEKRINEVLNDEKEGLIDNLDAKIINDSQCKFTIVSEDSTYDYTIEISFDPYRIDLSIIDDVTNVLDINAFKNHKIYSKDTDAEFFREESGKYIVSREVEKMSKSFYNVVNPDDICEEYGADTLRLYEMFLGPLEQAKPWNTAGITGVFGFLKKLWRLYADDNGLIVTHD